LVLSQAIQLDPKMVDAYYNRGIAYAHLGEWQKVPLSSPGFTSGLV
jgi:hypothetical protein